FYPSGAFFPRHVSHPLSRPVIGMKTETTPEGEKAGECRRKVSTTVAPFGRGLSLEREAPNPRPPAPVLSHGSARARGISRRRPLRRRPGRAGCRPRPEPAGRPPGGEAGRQAGRPAADQAGAPEGPLRVGVRQVRDALLEDQLPQPGEE